MERREVEERLAVLAPEVAQILGWQVVPRDEISHGFELVSPDGCQIWAQVGYPYGRLSIGGMIPRDEQGRQAHVPYKTNIPSISVSLSRHPPEVAKEISRRLLPEWIPIWEKMVAAEASQRSYEAQKQVGAERLAAIVGVPKKEIRGGKFSLYRSEAFPESISDVEVHGDDVRLDLRCSMKDAEAILKMLIELSR